MFIRCSTFSLVLSSFFNTLFADVGIRYFYPVPPTPSNPVQLDEPSSPSNTYLPPPSLDPFPDKPVSPYLPPPPQGLYPPEDNDDEDSVIIRPSVSVVNMSCVSNKYFRSTMKIKSDRFVSNSKIFFPVFEESLRGCDNVLLADALDRRILHLSIDGADKLRECGVVKCKNNPENICVTLRFPIVQNIKLPEDGLITLECTPLPDIVSHVAHVRLGLDTRTSRNGGKLKTDVLTGGTQRTFKTNVNLYRKGAPYKSFDQIVPPGSAVLLGEEVAVRVSVQEGDGWKYSKMGAVSIHNPASGKSAVLVNENGCRNVEMQYVCPYQPLKLTPLITVLPFRAFLFQNSNGGDYMILSVRMLACVHSTDCYQNDSCDGPRLRINGARVKRSTNGSSDLTNSSDMSGWESQLQFKVISSPQDFDSMHLTYIPFLVIAICCVILLVLLICYVKKR